MTDEHPLIEQIRQIEGTSAQGSLCLGHNDHTVRIHFQNGLIEAVSSNLAEFQLGQYLLRDGFIDSSNLSRLLKESFRRKIALGEIALRLSVLDLGDLYQLVHRQALQLFKRCLENGFQIRSFEASSQSFHVAAHMKLDFLLLELARDRSATFEVSENRRFMLKKERDYSVFPWAPQEIFMLSQLSYPRTLAELVSQTGFEESQVKRILNILRQLELIEISGDVDSRNAALGDEAALPLELLIPEVTNPVYDDKVEMTKTGPSFVSEQFKWLKFRIKELQGNRPAQVINVSSPDINDGKSLISLNLALCFARDPGRRVIILDCDFRNPSLQKYVAIPLRPGIIGYLQTAQLQPYCYMRRLGKLYVMTADGLADDDPVGLLSGNKMRELISYLKKEFDTIIMDSPPLQPIPDSSILSNLADGTLIVVRSGKTPYGTVERALKCVDPGKLLGVVFNAVKPLMFNTYHDHRYYYYGKNHYPYYGRNYRKRR
ncbi:MAG TPA: hypothetical protein VGK99_22725 [Acidobacteriota bacterium]|jgi:capsular exopolysaccharide synthesis family protein